MKSNNTSSMAITITLFFMFFLVFLPIYLYAQEDTTPPELVDFNFAPSSIDVTSNSQTVTFTAQITDAISGIEHSFVDLKRPSVHWTEMIDVDALISGDRNNGIFQGSVTINQCDENVIWIVSRFYVEDAVGNTSIYNSSELTSMGFPTELYVSSSCNDTTPPELVDFSFTPSSVDVSSTWQYVKVTAQITDAISGIDWSEVELTRPSGLRSWSSLTYDNLISGDRNNGIFQCSVLISNCDENGIWIFSEIWVKDAVGNKRSYSSSDLTSMGFPTELDVRSPCSGPRDPTYWDWEGGGLGLDLGPGCFINLTSPSGQWTEVFGVDTLIYGDCNNGIFQGSITSK